MLKYVVVISLLSILSTVSAFRNNKTGECMHVIFIPLHNVFFGDEYLVHNNTKEKCFKKCLSDVSCIAINWDYGNPGCFMFTRYETGLNTHDTVDQYSMLRNQTCDGSERNNTWLPHWNATWQGASKTIISDDLSVCVAACLRNSSCSGVSWFSNNSMCLLGFGGGDVVSSPGTMFYPKPYYIYPKEKQVSALASPVLKTQYIIIIVIGILVVLMVVVAVVLLCRYPLNRENNPIKPLEAESTNASEQGTLEKTEEDIIPEMTTGVDYGATYRSIDFRMSKDAATAEIIQENDQLSNLF